MRYSRMLILLLLISVFPALLVAQEDDEDKYSSWAFQSRVGLLSSNSENHKGGAVFDVALLKRFTGPIYLTGYAGTGNWRAEGALVPLSDEFAAAWESTYSKWPIISWDDLRYKVSYFGGGMTAIFEAGKLQPQLFAGVGRYRLSYVSSFTLNVADPGDDQIIEQYFSLGDGLWLNGFSLGGGLYYHYNSIINFGAEAKYHKLLDSPSLESIFTLTFGMHIRIP